MTIEASKYTKSATVERAREMLKRLHDRNQRTWDDLDRDFAFAIEALIASAERYRFIAHGTQAEQAQPVAHSLMCVCGAVWDIKPDGGEEMVHTPDAQPASKPVAWRWKKRINGDFDSWVVTSSEPPPYAIEKQPLYTAPPPRQWVGLTDEERFELAIQTGAMTADWLSFMKAVEDKLKAKNL
jgi:hypothetical protein